MKKSKIILHILALVVAVASFFLFRAYTQIKTDSVAPRISMDTDMIEVSVSDPEATLLQGISARDNRDGDVTHTVIIESITAINEEHVAVVSYAAFDRSGNVGKAQRNVRYTDYHAPRITLTHPACFTVNEAEKLMDFVGAQDVLEGDISHRVRATVVSNSSIRNEGAHTVHFGVTNSLGDSVQLEIPIHVYANGLYNAQLELSEYIIYLPKGSSFTPNNYLKTFTYSGNSINLSRTHPADMNVRCDNPVKIHTPGVYSVKYTVTFTDRNVTFTAYSNLIVVIEE